MLVFIPLHKIHCQLELQFQVILPGRNDVSFFLRSDFLIGSALVVEEE